jgi:hypothetical protein
MIVLNNRKDGMRPEVADIYYDNNIYSKWAFDNNKEFIKYQDDSVKPDTVVDTKIQDSTGILSDTLQNIINNDLKNLRTLDVNIKTYNTDTLLWQSEFYSKILDTLVRQIISNGDFIKKYNELIRKYIDPVINNNTRQIIKTDIQKLSKNIDIVIYLLFEFITKLLFIGDRPLKTEDYTDLTPVGYKSQKELKKFNDEHLINLIRIWCMYNCVRSDLFTGYFNMIDNISIETQYPNFIKELKLENIEYIEDVLSQNKENENKIRDVQKKNLIKKAVDEFISEYGREPSRQEIARMTMKLFEPSKRSEDIKLVAVKEQYAEIYDEFKKFIIDNIKKYNKTFNEKIDKLKKITNVKEFDMGHNTNSTKTKEAYFYEKYLISIIENPLREFIERLLSKGKFKSIEKKEIFTTSYINAFNDYINQIIRDTGTINELNINADRTSYMPRTYAQKDYYNNLRAKKAEFIPAFETLQKNINDLFTDLSINGLNGSKTKIEDILYKNMS